MDYSVIFGALMSLLSVVVGWALGLFTSRNLEQRKQESQKREFLNALVIELNQLRARLLASCYRLIKQYGQFDREFLRWFAQSGDGLFFVDDVIDQTLITRIRGLSDEELDSWINSSDTADRSGIMLKKHDAVLVTSNLPNVKWFEPDLSTSILDIVSNISMYHENIEEDRAFHFMTFSSELTDGNKAIVNKNLDNCYMQIGEHAKRISDKIGQLMAKIDKNLTYLSPP